jgi:hypothetical protein
MHLGLVPPQSVLCFNENHIELPLLGRSQEVQVAGSLSRGPGDLSVRVQVIVEDCAIVLRGKLTAQRELIVNGCRALVFAAVPRMDRGKSWHEAAPPVRFVYECAGSPSAVRRPAPFAGVATGRGR